MGLFEGKKLLELGTNTGSVDIVKYAKSEGAYVIVTDYLAKECSEAKQYADESLSISTLDIETLVNLIREKQIDGIFCGVSETNLKSVQTISAITGLPCYYTKEQWDLIENKAVFKQLCNKFHVPTARQYYINSNPTMEELANIEFPVIVKPVDLSASRGIHICKSKIELIDGYYDAYEKSPSHNVIVEQYILGDEISATYTFIDGDCRLSMLSQMYYNLEQKGLVPLPDAYIYPSKHLDAFLKKANEPIINMLKHIGLKNGSVFITGIASENNFAFFEAGLRLAGTVPYKFVSKINGINVMQLMTEYAINGNITNKSVLELEDPTLKGKICCLFSLLNGGGVIGDITGLEVVKSIPGIIHTTIQRKVGDVIKKDGTLGQVNLRFYIVKDTIEDICKVIEEIQRSVHVTDECGNDMLLKSNILSVLR